MYANGIRLYYEYGDEPRKVLLMNERLIELLEWIQKDLYELIEQMKDMNDNLRYIGEAIDRANDKD